MPSRRGGVEGQSEAADKALSSASRYHLAPGDRAMPPKEERVMGHTHLPSLSREEIIEAWFPPPF